MVVALGWCWVAGKSFEVATVLSSRCRQHDNSRFKAAVASWGLPVLRGVGRHGWLSKLLVGWIATAWLGAMTGVRERKGNGNVAHV